MQTVDEARHLARLMVSIANLADHQAVAIISDMNQPLGYSIGNALELKEAIKLLMGEGPGDLLENSLELASVMLVLGNICADED